MTSRSRIGRWACAAAATAALFAAGCRSAPAWMQNGSPAPALSGTTVDGRPVTLSAERGKVVAVLFFADWCPHCRDLYAAERSVVERMKGRPFAMIAVAPYDTADAVREAIRREQITWPVILDHDHANAAAWGVDGVPTIYVIDAGGAIRDFGATGATFGTVDSLVGAAK